VFVWASGSFRTAEARSPKKGGQLRSTEAIRSPSYTERWKGEKNELLGELSAEITSTATAKSLFRIVFSIPHRNPRTRAPGAPPPLTSLVPPPRCKPRRQLERGAPARSGPRRQLTRRAAPPGAETTSRQEPNQAAPPGPRSSPTQEPSGPRAGAALAADPAAPLGAAHAGAPAERSPTG
jgi:hypothetical protein